MIWKTLQDVFLVFFNTQGKEGLTVKFVWILLELIIRI